MMNLSKRANSVLESSAALQEGIFTIKLQETIHLDGTESSLCSDIMTSKILQYLSNVTEMNQDSARMKGALGEFLKRNVQFEIRPKNLLVGLCESVLITGISCCICNPQEKLLVFTPLDPNIEKVITMSGAAVHHVELSSKDGLAVNVPMLEEALREASESGVVRGVVFCNPVNPTGKTYSAEDIRGVIQWCIDNSLHIVINELFMLTVRESLLRHSGNLLDSPLVHWVYDLGKEFSGIRCGLLYSSNERLLQAVQMLLQPFQLSALDRCLVSQLCADQDWIQSTFVPENQRLLAANVAAVREQLREHSVEVMAAEGCPYVWADFRVVLGNQTESAEARLCQMMTTCGVDVCPSQQFGGKECGCFRIAIGHPKEMILVAMERVRQAVDALVQQRDEMGQDDTDVLFAAASEVAPSSLDGLMQQLYQQIKASEWLQENSAVKWEEENPDLARDYRARIEKHD